MDKNYLWDKSGEDAEIKHLENILQAFRQTEYLAPILPKNNVQIAKISSWKSFRFAFAAAACLAITLISFGIWLQPLDKKLDITTIANMPKSDPVILKYDDKFSEDAPVKTIDKKNMQNSERLTQPLKRIIPAVNFQTETKIEKIKFVRKVRIQPTEINLTKEEKFAYDQLKLALAITGSGLKIVKNTIDGEVTENVVIPKTTTN